MPLQQQQIRGPELPEISEPLAVYACQMDIAWEDKPANFARFQRLLEDAEPRAGGLIVLPEMFATGFSMNAAAITEDPRTGRTGAFLADTAQRFGCHVLAGVVTSDRPGGAHHNEALIFAPDGSITGRYAKQRPFTPSGERDCYGAGICPVVLDINGLRVAPFICYDLRFPELFRSALSLDVDAFIVIASWPGARIQHWDTLLRARAIENQAYVVGVNRVGTDPTPLTYPGHSVVLDPSGAPLAEAGDRECVITATLAPSFVAQYRRELPFLNDR
ncbi:MAG: nitrilase-related carbon-nitrogen hydrolase [Armatimonadota bacterium]